MPSSSLTVGGVALDFTRYRPDTLLAFARGGVPTLTFAQVGGALPASPDPIQTAEVIRPPGLRAGLAITE